MSLHGTATWPLERRIAVKIRFQSGTGCWLWTGAQNNKGYGYMGFIRADGKRHCSVAHRAVYEHFVGPIPNGLDLDHLCRNPLCVNPTHVEPVTRRTNLMRSNAVSAVNARKTVCLRGHKFDRANTIVSKLGSRNCRACKRLREGTAAYKQKRLLRLRRKR